MSSDRIGVLGGTFDPVHIGHLIMAVELQSALNLDRVLFVPAGDPPHKPSTPISPAVHRIRMLELAIAGREDFTIDLTDINRAGPSYTKDLVSELTAQYPHHRLVFLMGTDSLRDLENWKDPARILELAEIGAASRPDVHVDLDRLYKSLPGARGRVTLVEIPLIGVSSSDLRTRVQKSRPISYQVPATVERYILENSLYSARPGPMIDPSSSM